MTPEGRYTKSTIGEVAGCGLAFIPVICREMGHDAHDTTLVHVCLVNMLHLVVMCGGVWGGSANGNTEVSTDSANV